MDCIFGVESCPNAIFVSFKNLSTISTLNVRQRFWTQILREHKELILTQCFTNSADSHKWSENQRTFCPKTFAPPVISNTSYSYRLVNISIFILFSYLKYLLHWKWLIGSMENTYLANIYLSSLLLLEKNFQVVVLKIHINL